jgi:adenine-specific DNA-methyltransferase
MTNNNINKLISPWKITDIYSEKSTIVLYRGDANTFLASLPKNKISLVITSPPYNIGKEYEKKVSLDEYLAFHTKIIAKIDDVIRDDGSVCWQVGNYIENGELIPLDIKFYNIFKTFGFKLRNRIVWHYRHGLHASKKFSGRYETLLWFTKSDKYIFNLDSVRVPSKYPGKRYYKGEKKGIPSGNPNGKNPSDVWETIITDWEAAFWDIPNVKANHPEKTIQPCQFPIELVERCILALTKPKQWVLDPFSGVGSTLIAAAKNNRISLGSEKEQKYYNIAKKRLGDLKKGILKIRPIGKPIHEPNGNEKVAQIPDEWKRKKHKSSK